MSSNCLNVIHTIFGKVKRVRLIATIIEKNEKLIESDEFEIGLEDDSKTNVRLIFSLDDNTGLIRAYKDNVNPENFITYNIGDVVDVDDLIPIKRGTVNKCYLGLPNTGKTLCMVADGSKKYDEWCEYGMEKENTVFS